MVRTGGLEYAIAPAEKMGARISDMRVGGKPVEAGKTQRSPAGRRCRRRRVRPAASRCGRRRDVAQKARPGGRVAPRQVNTPRLVGMQGNPGMA